VTAWLAEKELVPGQHWHDALEDIIQTTKSAAVLIAKDGLGPWEIPEMRACIDECVNRRLPEASLVDAMMHVNEFRRKGDSSPAPSRLERR
jgi:hypothetical protein